MPALSPCNPHSLRARSPLPHAGARGTCFLGRRARYNPALQFLSKHAMHQAVQKACKWEANVPTLEEELSAAVLCAEFASAREWGWVVPSRTGDFCREVLQHQTATKLRASPACCSPRSPGTLLSTYGSQEACLLHRIKNKQPKRGAN